MREKWAKAAWAESRNVEESAEALKELIERRGHRDPAPRYWLARIYSQAGLWDSAHVC